MANGRSTKNKGTGETVRSMPQVRIPSVLYHDLETIAENFGTSITQETEKAVSAYIKNVRNKRIQETSLLGDITRQMKRMEDRLAALLAKQGMDTATAVELLLVALGNRRNEDEIDRMYWEARKKAVIKFTRKLMKKEFDPDELVAAAADDEGGDE